MTLEYKGGKQEIVLIEAKVYFPLLQVENQFIDFGIVPVGRRRNKFLTLKNVSHSACYFNISSNHLFK